MGLGLAPGRGVGERVEGGEARAGPLHHLVAGVGQAHGLPAAGEELHRQGRLEALHPPAHGGLRHAQRAGRAPQAAAVHDRDEGLEVLGERAGRGRAAPLLRRRHLLQPPPGPYPAAASRACRAPQEPP